MLDLLGAEMPRGLLIRLKNTNSVVAQQGGKGGAIAASVAEAFPELAGKPLETVVLEKMAGEFRKQLAAKGVDADVTVVSATAHQPATSGFAPGMFVGAGVGAGVVGALWALLRSRK